MTAGSAVARRAFGDARVRTISFALLFAVAALLQATAYREGYPTRAERVEFARSVGGNSAARVLYGAPHELLTVGGYVSWRVGGTLAVFAGLWALLGAVRAMRAEEDWGRADVVLAGVVGRRGAFVAQLVAIGAGAAVLWLVTFAALALGQVPVAGSAYLALAIVSVVPVFAGVGAVTSQLAPTRRGATGLAAAVLVVAFGLRAVADTSGDGPGWVRWLSPFGWAEELRPFADPRPAPLLLPAVAGAVLLVTAAALAVRRDVGRGILPVRDTAPARLRLLGSPTALALRLERGPLLAWMLGLGAFGFLVGFLSGTVTDDVLSEEVRQQLEKLGTESVATPAGFLGFIFLFVVLAVSVFCCLQLAAARSEEAEQRLETVLALPVRRRWWLAGRLALAAAGAAAVALVAGALAWAGAAAQDADLSLLQMLGAGANTLPAALLFLALGALAVALAPRAGTTIAFGLVAAAFLGELFGALLGAPGWLLALSPFHDVALVPGEPFDAAGAAAMLGLAVVASLAALWAFERRDLSGA